MRIFKPNRGAALLALAAAGVTAAAQAAPAPPAPPPPPPPNFGSPAPRFNSGDNAFEFKVRGRVQMDLVNVSSSYNQRAFTAGNTGLSVINEEFTRSASRRVRLGVDGRMNSKFRYRVEFESNRGAIAWTDLIMEYIGKDYSVVLGNQKGIAALDEVTSDPVNLFNERAAYQNAFALGDRRLGVLFKKGGPNWTFDAGLYGDSINNAETSARTNGLGVAEGTNATEAYAAGVRATFAPIFSVTPEGARILHLGMLYRYRNQGDDALLSYTARPGISNYAAQTINTSLSTTNPLAANSGFQADETWNFEAAYIHGPVGVVAEYAEVSARRPNSTTIVNPAAAREFSFSGGYVDAFWQITGENRIVRQGEIRRMVPRKSIVEGGPGLWQVGARYEVLDLKDGTGNCFGTGVTVGSRAICGGVYNTVGAVVNWQPVEFIKVTGQYATTSVRGGINTSATNRRDGTVDVWQTRVQFDF
ncbi:MAG: OprO/OprP family phosphate-selective porin [Caulobacterales bacterium]